MSRFLITLRTVFGARDAWSIRLVIAAAVVLLAHLTVVSWLVFTKAGQLTFFRLHYTAGLGVDRIGPWWMMFLYPAIGLAALLVTGPLSAVVHREHRALGLVVHGTTLLVQVFLAIGGGISVILNR